MNQASTAPARLRLRWLRWQWRLAGGRDPLTARRRRPVTRLDHFEGLR